MLPLRSDEVAAPPRGVIAAGAAAVVAYVALKVSPLTFVDPDLFHQLALAREALALGALPLRDSFSYTPTLVPLVHHEWGAGLVWYGVLRAVGGGGFLAVKYLLVAAVLALSARAARRGGAPAVALIACGMPAAYAAHYGFTTVRAALLSMLCLAALLNVLLAARSRPRWAAAAVPLLGLWMCFHAGFVVGLGLLGLEAIERALRRERFAHLAVAAVAAAALVLATPYGLAYPRYLVHALFMARPDFPEWAPLWVGARWADLGCWAAMVALAGYGLRARGPRGCEGAAGVAVFALSALLHHRHLTLFAVLWYARVPAWLADAPLTRGLTRVASRRAGMLTLLLGVTAAVWFAAAMLLRPWALTLPTTVASRVEGWPTYPVGAVGYLKAHRFRGRLMTPFQEGAYAMWHLAPQGVRVSFDSRYEAAYPPRVGRAHAAFYAGAPIWRAVLRAWPPDAVLVPRDAGVLAPLLALPGWRVTYGDDLYLLVVPDAAALPFVDRRGVEFVGRLP